MGIPAVWSLLRLVTRDTGIQTSWMYADFFSFGIWCKISVALSSRVVQLAMFLSSLWVSVERDVEDLLVVVDD
jgi:hypothetical protein